MEVQRQGEIARAMIKHYFAKRGLKVDRAEIMSEVGNLFLDLDDLEPNLKLTTKELLEFYLTLNRELMTGFESKSTQRLMLR